MSLQRTDSGWSCLAASFATVLGLTLREMYDRVGHDGSEVIFPEEPDPERRRAFHPQEMIDVAESLGVAVTAIQGRPTSRPFLSHRPAYEVPLDVVPRWQRYLEGHVGVLTGLNARYRPHAVVWDGEDVWDPAGGERYGIHLFQPEIFWRATRLGAPLHLDLSPRP
jgi:hypothetical protein